MTIHDFISRLDGVRRSGRGYMARCPTHQDRSPSLSIKEGDRGVLVRCFAGCTVKEICRALGLGVSDLFFDAVSNDPSQRRQEAERRDHEGARREAQRQADGLVIDALKAAEAFIGTRRGLDIRDWSNERLDAELNALGDAYCVLESEESHD